jgi:GNAT superfamily N-acetyltransferase
VLTVTLVYEIDGAVESEEILVLLRNGGFLRPLDDPERTRQMVENGTFHVTVREAGELIGWTRVLTDFVYYGLVMEVAVAPTHKGQGVGREMLRMARETATGKVTLVLISSEEGDPFYEHLGWQRADRARRLRRTE